MRSLVMFSWGGLLRGLLRFCQQSYPQMLWASFAGVLQAVAGFSGSVGGCKRCQGARCSRVPASKGRGRAVARAPVGGGIIRAAVPDCAPRPDVASLAVRAVASFVSRGWAAV